MTDGGAGSILPPSEISSKAAFDFLLLQPPEIKVR